MSANSNLHHRLVVTVDQAGSRLDRVLAELEFISSRSRGAELIERGLVTLNGKPLRASFKVQAGHTIDIELPATVESHLVPLDAPLDIIFEDDDVLVVNKPSGLVVHPAAGHAQDTLVNILLHHVQSLSMGFSENRPGIVHRLDRDTSGILVVAKNDLAHHSLVDQFRLKTAHRIYWALTHGRPSPTEKTIRTHLTRHSHDRKRYASNPNGVGKLAITHVKILQTTPSDITWVQCRLETGRTHQIRVHLSETGTPIVGDPLYGRGRKLSQKAMGEHHETPRLALHACELGFVHPRTKEPHMFKLGWPPDLVPIVKALELKNV